MQGSLGHERLVSTLVSWMAHNAFNPQQVELAFGLTGAELPGWELDLGSGRRIGRRLVREREELEQRLAHPLGAVGIPAPAGKYLPVGTKEHTAADVGRQLVEVIESQGRSESWFGHQSRQNTPVPLSRIAWIATVAICVVAAVLVLLNGYVGYFFVLLAVGASAAVNLK